MKTKLMTIAAASGLALSLSACGSDAASEAESTVEEFATAVSEEDFETVCDLIDPAQVKEMEQALGGECVEGFEQLAQEAEGDELKEFGDIEILESTVGDDEETATVTTKDTNDEEVEMNLKKVDDEWKISIPE